jgi:hypothetical protein
VKTCNCFYWPLPHLPYLILIKLELLLHIIPTAAAGGAGGAAAAGTPTAFASEKWLIAHLSNVLWFKKGPVSAKQRASCSTWLVILYQDVNEVATWAQRNTGTLSIVHRLKNAVTQPL